MTNILVYSFIFYLRRLRLAILGRPDIKVVLVDMDETLLKDFSTFREGLRLIFGNKDGLKEYNLLMRDIAKQRLDSKALMLASQQLLLKGKFEKKDENRIIKRAKENVNKRLVVALKQLKKNGKIIVICTKSSERIADYFVKKYGFDFGLGTRMIYDGKGFFFGAEHLVADEDSIKNGIVFRTKLGLLKDKYLSIKDANVAVISDAVTDVKTMVSSGLAILLSNNNKNSIQEACLRFKLYDLLIDENDDITKKLVKL